MSLAPRMPMSPPRPSADAPQRTTLANSRRATAPPRAARASALACLTILLAVVCGACGQRTRTVTRYDDGTPCAEIDFKAGVLDGAYLLHHPTGHLELEAHYVAGLREGTYAAWHPNGVQAVTGQYAHGLREGTWQEWGENGAAISAGAYVAGDKTGLWRVFDAQGALAAEDEWEHATRLARRLVPVPPVPPAPTPK